MKKSLIRTDTNRLYFLDWLRITAIIVVFLLHCAKMFDFHTTVVSNIDKSLFLSAFRDFTLIWVMPLFFTISGATIFLSQKTESIKNFVKTKFLRLVVPLLFVGTFLVNAVYVYIERLSANQTIANFFQWYPHYFDGVYGFGGNFAFLGNGTYLWYLQFLFIFSIVLFPLFTKSKNTGVSFLTKLSSHLEKPWAVLLLFVPISLSSVLFEAIGLGGIRVMGGWDLISYMFFFVYGYIIFCNPTIKSIIYKYSPLFLVAALILSFVYLDSHFGITMKIDGITRHNLAQNGTLYPLNIKAWLFVLAVKGLLSWLWILSLLGLGHKYLNFNNKFLSYANEAVLPFYILHHAIIYSVGYQILKINTGPELKFIVIALLSFVLIMTIYELVIKRIPAIRFLFGMKK